MRLEVKKNLFDIRTAVELLTRFTVGISFRKYQCDAMLQAAVEPKFEVIGEAVAKLARLDEKFASRISEYQRIIAFRNVLIHGYADVDDRLVWDVVETHLPTLRREIEFLLKDERQHGSSD